MISDLLHNMESSGSYTVLPRGAVYSDRQALLLHVKALQVQGHTIASDEVVAHGERTGELRVTHFLSCAKCREGK